MANFASNFGNPNAIGANGTLYAKHSDGAVICFVCTVGGTLDLYDGHDNTGTHFVSALPVTGGQTHVIPCAFSNGLYVACSGGAAGTIIWI